MRIEKRRTMPINGHVIMIELDVAGPKVRMIGVLMKTEHQAPIWFDPVDAVVLVVDTGRVPEANFQSCVLHVVGVP